MAPHAREVSALSLHGRVALAIALALAAGPTLNSAGAAGLVGEQALPAGCPVTSITVPVEADAWIADNSPFANKGSDSVLLVEPGSPRDPVLLPDPVPFPDPADPQDPSAPSEPPAPASPPDARGIARALVRFERPVVPEGCVVESARLRLFAPEESVGAKAEVLQIATEWSESLVTWNEQPATTGEPVTAWSREGYMQWTVTRHVLAMLAPDAPNHGFLVRDSAEGEVGGAGHSFYAREKGDGASLPQLVIRFAVPPGPAGPTPAVVSCGQELTQSTQLMNDLLECPGDGLVIAAHGITVDLNGHTIDGIGLGTGIRIDGYSVVTVMNSVADSGAVQQFDYGIQLLSESRLNIITGLRLQQNELAGIELFDAGTGGRVNEEEFECGAGLRYRAFRGRYGNMVANTTIDGNGDGIALVSGTTGTLVVNNDITLSRGWGLRLRDSSANVVGANRLSDGGDLAVGLERAHWNTLLRNSASNHSDLGIGLHDSSRNTLCKNIIAANSDGGIEIREGSNDNLVAANELDDSGDHGILIERSDGNRLLANRANGMSDNGIFLSAANHSLVSRNDVRYNTGGLQIDGSSNNVFESNIASETTGIGIELGAGSYSNYLLGNTANANGAQGIYVMADVLDGLGNVLEGNVASGNLSDGIATGKGGHRLARNIANDNGAWGINAALGTIGGGGNRASGNAKVEQCIGIVCDDVTPPETTITDGPAAKSASSWASFSFSGADNLSNAAVSTFECRLDDQDFVACSSPNSYSNLAIGPHTFEVRAIDAAGNVDASPASARWETTAACPAPTTVVASADAWIDQSSPVSNGGTDAILKVRSQRRNGNFRALVQFTLPALPQGCEVESATLQMYSDSARAGRTLQAVRIGAPWAEHSVSWGNQPLTTGTRVTTSSGIGVRSWSVTSQVQEMYTSGQPYGFLIRDAVESNAGAEQSFHAKEKGENVPVLVLRFVGGS